MAQLQALWGGSGEEEVVIGVDMGVGPDQTLASLWSHTVPDGAAELAGVMLPEMDHHQLMAPTANMFTPPRGDDFQIEFDDGDSEFWGGGVEGSTSPNEAVRFQIGRQDPPRGPTFDRTAHPIDGQVVSTRGSDGRFRQVPRPPPPRPRVTESVPMRTAPARSAWERIATPRPQVHAAPAPEPDRSNIPTAMERLGSSPWD